MPFLLSPELQEFQKSLRRYFEKNFPPMILRKFLLGDSATPPSDVADRCWTELVELGVFSAAIPESRNGLGLGFLSLVVIVEEEARVLCPLPLFETLTFGVVPLLRCSDHENASDLLERIASGTVKVSGTSDPSDGMSAVSAKNAVHCTAQEMSVSSLDRVQAVVCAIPEKSKRKEYGIFELELGAASEKVVTRVQQHPFDLIRRYDAVSFAKLPARFLGALSSVEMSAVTLGQSLLAAAELAAVGARVLELALEHAKTRQQFGRPIGSFQAVQQKLADMHLRTEQARNLVRHAAWSADNSPEQFPSSAMSAKGFASEHVPEVIEAGLQVLGGIGFTFEHDLHLYLRRAQTLAQLFGASDECYLALGESAVARAEN